MTPVLWLKARPLCWDQDMVDRLLSGRLWRTRHRFGHHVDELPADCEGAVVVVPARYYRLAEIQQLIDQLRWVLLILTSDEESTFPVDELDHPNMRTWVMTPRPGIHQGHSYVGEGWAPDTPELLERMPEQRTYDWMFAGQVTHDRRQECAKTLRTLTGGVLIETAGFAQGLPREDYLRLLSSSKVAACPSGPATPDSFRLYEALEAGCVPVVDDPCPGWDRLGYWPLVLGETPPFPVVFDWADFGDIVDIVAETWPQPALHIRSWWQRYKRRLAHRLDRDLDELDIPAEPAIDDLITAIVPTSPVTSHPDTAIIETTIASIRERLPAADIIITCDGIRDEQAHLRPAYDDYLARLTRLCVRWRAIPIISQDHVHQANTARAALEHTHTPLVLFVEHDTPLCESIDLEGIATAVLTGDANLVRLHHESRVLQPHRHLMLDDEPQQVAGVPMLRTAQWSQRPHIAGTDFYREIIGTYFGRDSRTMIEDVMHGVVDQAWREHGHDGWDLWRLWLYAPDGDMKRSLHLDGRAGESKFDDQFVFAYDGPVPDGAPQPTATRCD